MLTAGYAGEGVHGPNSGVVSVSVATSWTLQNTPDPGGPASSLTAVWCESWCFAVGSFVDGASQAAAFGDQWSRPIALERCSMSPHPRER